MAGSPSAGVVNVDSVKLADSFSFDGDDYSNPSASSYASQANPYRTGDYYTVSGRSNTGLGLGKILVYGGLVLAGYWLYKRMKRG